MRTFIAFSAGVLLAVGVSAVYFNSVMVASASVEQGTCRVTITKVAIGKDVATQLIATSSTRQWAVMQQPQNATNTVTLNTKFPMAATTPGYLLSPATTTVDSRSELRVGYATDLTTDQPVYALTTTGSSTVNVIDCK